MLTLTELVREINKKFPQQTITLPMFDFRTFSKLAVDQPKFLYRGERSADWKTSFTTIARNKILKREDFAEINHFQSGRIYPFGDPYPDYHYSLYNFIREAIFDPNGTAGNDPFIDFAIAGLLQHYGFDTAFLDVTGDLNIAAAFAATGAVGDVGQILLLPTQNIPDQYFDLSMLPGLRPKAQRAFALWGTDQLDLKNNSFLKKYGAQWLQFKLSEEDQSKFLNTEMLNGRGDEVIETILDWYETHISHHTRISSSVHQYFTTKIDGLKKACL